MDAGAWGQFAQQWGAPGVMVAAFLIAIFTDRIFFPRDIRNWQARLDDKNQQLDRADRRADAATEIASASAEKISELTELVRMLLIRREA